MSLLLKQIYAFIKLLNSDTGTNQLAAGLSCGLILGFAPFVSLQTILVLVLVFFFRIQMGAAFLSAFFFKFIAYTLDGITHPLGRWVLEREALHPLFAKMYNMPVVPLTRFNNTIVMGSLVLTVLFCPLFFILFRKLIIKYRETILARFKDSKIWKAFATTKIYGWYSKYQELYG